MLLLHRRLGRDAVLAGIRAALAAGSVSADVVAIEARKANPATPTTATTAPPVPAPRRSATALVTLQARQQARAPCPDLRPVPSVGDYDQLLTRRAACRDGS